MKRLHVLIKGRVQGVAFRYATQRKASQLSLTGWVRNLPDGRVEAIFEGEDNLLNEMLVWCEHGPDLARVDTIESTWELATNDFASFDIVH